MKVRLVQVVAMINACTLCASAPTSTHKDYRRNEKERNYRTQKHVNGNDERELNDTPGLGKGRGKGVTMSGLDICLNRLYKSVVPEQDRSLQGGSRNENESRVTGKGNGKGIRKPNSRCAPRNRGKGESSKSKGSKRGSYTDCTNYEFPIGNEFHSQKVDNKNEIKNVLDVAKGIPRLSIFVDLIEKSSLAAVLDCAGPFTLLIPANRAFRTLDPAIFADLLLRDKTGKLDDILSSHIVPEKILSNQFLEGNLKTLKGDVLQVAIKPLTLNKNATIGTRDIMTANGVIHIIDSILLTNVSQSVCDSGQFDFDGPSCGLGCSHNLIDLACGLPQLSTFLSLVQLSGLKDIFECRGPFTLFVPTNEAFDNLRGHVWLQLLKLENRNDLKDLLLYHMIPGSFLQRELKVRLAGTPSLLFNRNITISKNPFMVDTSQVIESDFLGCNGVLHIIDEVLDHTQPMLAPPNQLPQQNPVSKTVPPTFEPSTLAGSLEPSVIPSRQPSVVSSAPLLSNSPTISPSAAPIPQSEPPTTMPSVSSSANPSASPSVGVVRININQRFFFAYVSDSNEEPTASNYEDAQRITIEYYEDYIRGRLMMDRPQVEFLEWNTTLVDTRFNAGIPSQRFNIYMEYAMTVALYSKESRNVPSPGQFLLFLTDGYVLQYLLNITSLTGTPFEMVKEGVYSTI